MSSVIEPARVDVVRQREVVDALRAFMPGDAVLFDREQVQPYECDGLTAYRQLPLVVALPETEAQVQRVLQDLPSRSDVPVVARGAGTGLSGGALPPGDGVMLSTGEVQPHRARRPARAHRASCSPACATSRSREAAAPLRPVLRARSVAARSPAPSAATSPRTRAACTA